MHPLWPYPWPFRSTIVDLRECWSICLWGIQMFSLLLFSLSCICAMSKGHHGRTHSWLATQVKKNKVQFNTWLFNYLSWCLTLYKKGKKVCIWLIRGLRYIFKSRLCSYFCLLRSINLSIHITIILIYNKSSFFSTYALLGKTVLPVWLKREMTRQ